MNRSDLLIAVMVLSTLGAIFLWCMDVSVSAIVVDGVLVNAYWSVSPQFMYHVGIIGMLAVIFSLAVISIKSVLALDGGADI